MKAANFQVVAEARRAAEGQLSFFNRMMEAKTANSTARKPVEVVNRKAGTATRKK
jgi:hypothetical protein